MRKLSHNYYQHVSQLEGVKLKQLHDVTARLRSGCRKRRLTCQISAATHSYWWHSVQEVKDVCTFKTTKPSSYCTTLLFLSVTSYTLRSKICPQSIIDCSAAQTWHLPNMNVYSQDCLQYVTFAIHYTAQRWFSLRKTCCSLLQCIMKGCKWANLQLWQPQPQQKLVVIGSEVPLQRLLWWECCGWK